MLCSLTNDKGVSIRQTRQVLLVVDGKAVTLGRQSGIRGAGKGEGWRYCRGLIIRQRQFGG